MSLTAAAQPGITLLIVGASKVDQLHDKLAAFDLTLASEQLETLDELSALGPAFPYGIFPDAVNRGIFGGATVRGWR